MSKFQEWIFWHFLKIFLKQPMRTPSVQSKTDFQSSSMEWAKTLFLENVQEAQMLSAPSLSNPINVETVPILVCLNSAFSIPLSFRQSVLWCSGLSMFRKFLEPFSFSALPSCRLVVMSLVFASLPAWSLCLASLMWLMSKFKISCLVGCLLSSSCSSDGNSSLLDESGNAL